MLRPPSAVLEATCNRQAWRLAALAFFAFLLCAGGEPPQADARVTWDATESLIERGTLALPAMHAPPELYVERDGKLYGQFPLGNVLAMVPSALLCKLLQYVPLGKETALRFACHLSPALLMAAACALFFTLLRRRGATNSWATALTLVLAFCTICFIYARQPYSEALQTFALLWLVERTLAAADEPTRRNVGGLALAAAVLLHAKWTYALVLPASAIYVSLAAWRGNRIQPLGRALPGAIALFAILIYPALWYNDLKTGSYWKTGYGAGYPPGGMFSGDLGYGLWGLLLSSGEGIFLYSPPLLLGVLGLPRALRERRAQTQFVLAVLAIQLVLDAKFVYWFGGWCWGPRYLVPLTPLVLLTAHPWLSEIWSRGRIRLRRLAVAACLTLGLAVQGLGTFFYWDCYLRILVEGDTQLALAPWYQRLGSPAYSAVRGHAWLLTHWLRDDADLDRDAPWRSQTNRPVDLRLEWSRLQPDWWFLHVRRESPALAWLLLGSLAAGTLAAATLVRREEGA